MSITLRQLEIFYTVAKIGHVTNSSEILGISQSAISMALQELEKSLETKLFERVLREQIIFFGGLPKSRVIPGTKGLGGPTLTPFLDDKEGDVRRT